MVPCKEFKNNPNRTIVTSELNVVIDDSTSHFAELVRYLRNAELVAARKVVNDD